MCKYIEKLTSLRGSEYDYSKAVYNGNKGKITILCKIHGEFQQRYDHHLKGSHCQKCANISRSVALKDSLEQFISKARNLHKDSYDYSLISGINRKAKVPIICKICNIKFMQTTSSHLEGHGCPVCNSNYVSGMTINSFVSHCQRNSKGLGTLYIAKLFKDTEVFYKVGITSLDVNTRFLKIPYEYTILHKSDYEADKVYKDEESIKNILKDFIYKPKQNFDGSMTECFSVNPKDYLYLL